MCVQIVRSIEGSGRQLMAWMLKWIVALALIYLVRCAFLSALCVNNCRWLDVEEVTCGLWRIFFFFLRRRT